VRSLDQPMDLEKAASGSERPRILEPALLAFVQAERT
jgi:hypothetical protein